MAANGAAENGSEAQPRQFNDVFSSLPTTVFEEMSLLAAKHQSVNLVGVDWPALPFRKRRPVHSLPPGVLIVPGC